VGFWMFWLDGMRLDAGGAMIGGWGGILSGTGDARY